MVLLDTSGSNDFIMQKVYFADDIRLINSNMFSISISRDEILSNSISVIYIDIFGNEFKERIRI